MVTHEEITGFETLRIIEAVAMGEDAVDLCLNPANRSFRSAIQCAVERGLPPYYTPHTICATLC